MLLYAGKDKNKNSKFTVHNLQQEFQHNLEKIRNEQWLGEFPRGAHLLDYLYKILMCCESDLQAVDLLRDIFTKTIQPLLEMIDDFIYRGVFDDPFNEFFIEKQEIPNRKARNQVSVTESILMQQNYRISRYQDTIPEFIG